MTIPAEDRGFVVLRLDGRGFSRWTSDLTKPFSLAFHIAMVDVTTELMRHSGASVAYTQSDEITLVIPYSNAWFQHREHKLTSVSAGIASAKMTRLWPDKELAVFDSRVVAFYTTFDGVVQEILARAYDARRNSINTAAHYLLPDVNLHGVGTWRKLELLREAGHDWGALPAQFKIGVIVHDVWGDEEREYIDKRDGLTKTTTALRRRQTVVPLDHRENELADIIREPLSGR